MEAFAFYLLKSVVWLAGFTVVYLIFLRNERFFILKRAYLLTGILASFVLPFITLHYQAEVPAPSTAGDISIAGILTSEAAAEDLLSGIRGILFFLLILYLSGIIFLVYR